MQATQLERLLPPLLVTLALLVVGPTSAKACSPKCIDSQVFPNETTQHVPTNTRVWILGRLGQTAARGRYLQVCEADRDIRLETVAGEVVSTSTTKAHDAWVLSPVQPLAIGTRYRVRASCPAYEFEDVEFEVTTDADHDPPSRPEVVLGDLVVQSDECFDLRYRKIVVGGPSPMVFVDAGADAVLPSAWPQRLPVEGVTEHLDRLGHAGCGPGYWSGGATRQRFRFAAVDLAGNWSDWTDPVSVSLSRLPAGMCSVNPDPPRVPFGWLLAGLIVGLRRGRGPITQTAWRAQS